MRNVTAFLPANAITIEYSRDGGTTWHDYNDGSYWTEDVYNEMKERIFTERNSGSKTAIKIGGELPEGSTDVITN